MAKKEILWTEIIDLILPLKILGFSNLCFSLVLHELSLNVAGNGSKVFLIVEKHMIGFFLK